MTAYRFAQPELDEVAIFVDRLTLFIGFCVTQGDRHIADGAN
jgi:hypothetical protein